MSEIQDFTVKSIWHEYQVRFVNDLAQSLLAELKEGDLIIIDKDIKELYQDKLDPVLQQTAHLALTASEDQKEFSRLAQVINHLIENGFRKNHRLVAIGGGIIQDITGFLASILYRGVDWLFAPTTLLSQCDSCIGSKTSINFASYKNQLGTFYPPRIILVDNGFLDTLPELDLRSGIGEMIHYFLIAGRGEFEFIRDNRQACLQDKSVLLEAVSRSLTIKRAMIQKDEFDRNERQIFNYGHSFGHALETLSNYRIPHGIAVSYGMDLANHLSAKLGYISPELRQEIRPLLEANWRGVGLGRINSDQFIAALGKDKKNVGNQIKVILTRGLGDMFKTTLPMNPETKGWIEEFFVDVTSGTS